jgi:hypothetical protein
MAACAVMVFVVAILATLVESGSLWPMSDAILWILVSAVSPMQYT